MSLKLEKSKKFSGRPGPLLLIIMDGVGIGKQDESDAVFLADTPCLDQLKKSDLYTTLQAHGTAVGMPSDEDMGNSEVGHNALGAGRVFAQGAQLVNNSIESQAVFKTEVWGQIRTRVKEKDGTLHLIGLLSDGNVHSNIKHLFAILEEAAASGMTRVRLHVLLDGRDVYEKSALTYIDQTEDLISRLNAEHGADIAIASGGGRMVTTMDRYNADWDVVKRGWDAHVLGKARQFASAHEAVQTYYDEDPKITDQYLDSFVVARDGAPVGTIEDGDAVVFFNFRGDRAIELSRAFEEKNFDKFERGRVPDILYAGMMEYDGDMHIPKHYLVNPPQIDRTVGDYLCASGVTSFALSETQKFGHVTYFWNGNNSGYVDEKLEYYTEVPSDKVRFDEKPKMKAEEITDKTIELLKSGKYRFGRINFPNGDMVGHTGVPEAIITAMTTVDRCTARLIETVKELNGITVVTADHGNAEEMYKVKNGKKTVMTSHSLNPVPFAIIDPAHQGEYTMADLKKRGLSNVAATLINLLGYEAPEDYDPTLIAWK